GAASAEVAIAPPFAPQPTAIRRRITATTGESASAPTPVLCPSRFLPLRVLPHHPGHPGGGLEARLRTFQTRAQIEIMLPVCRTPPGQYTGIPQAHPETEWLPRF